MIPQCFGMVVVHSLECEACKKCKHGEDCSRKVLSSLNLISERHDVSDISYLLVRNLPVESVSLSYSSRVDTEAPRTRFALSDQQEEILKKAKSKYAKSERLIKSIFKNGIDLHRSLLNNKNPFLGIKTNKYMRIVCDRLMDDGFTREELLYEFMDEFGWTRETANSCIVLVVHSLSSLDIIIEENEKFKLRRVG